MKTRSLWIVALLLVATACGGSASPEKQAQAAQDALNAGDYKQACQLCDDALLLGPVQGDPVAATRLKLIRARSLAALGKTDDVLAALGDLPAASMTTALYVDLAGRLKTAGKLVGAIEVADAGTKRFPDKKAAFAALIEDLKASAAAGGDNAALEQLRSLGYL